MLQDIIKGTIPNIEWPLNRNKQLLESLKHACKKWVYNGIYFHQAAKNKRCSVPLMPVLSYMALVDGVCPTCTEASAVLPDVDPARLYCCHTSLLRELVCGWHLCNIGTVIKNPWLDVNEGTDWLVRTPDKEYKVQISHEGAASRAYYDRRKASKTDASVVILTARASRDGELDLVDRRQIAALFD
jgi:hypothetical protein